MKYLRGCGAVRAMAAERAAWASWGQRETVAMEEEERQEMKPSILTRQVGMNPSEQSELQPDKN